MPADTTEERPGTDSNDKLIAVQVRLPPSLYHKLTAVADRERRSRSGQLAVFVEESLARLDGVGSGTAAAR